MFIVIIDCVKMNFKLFDGDFFDYEWVIFKDIKFQVILFVIVFKEVVNCVVVLVDKNVNNCVEFLVFEGILCFVVEGDYGCVQDMFSVIQGGIEQVMSFVFNVCYVFDVLGLIDGDVELLFFGFISFVIFCVVGGGGGYMVVMVMLCV